MKLKFWESFKGFVDKHASPTPRKTHLYERSWQQRCEWFDQLAVDHGLAKSQCMTIAGQCTANGIFLKPVQRSGEEYPRSQEAVKKLEEFNKQIHIRSLIHQTAYHMALRGSYFWEKTWTPTYNVRAIPLQKYLEPAEIDPTQGVTRWRQNLPGTHTKPEWSADEIVPFVLNPTDESWPFGTSLISSLGTEFTTLAQLEVDTKEYMHKNAFPKEIVSAYDKDFIGSDSDLADIRGQFRNWEPGETVATNYPIKYTAGGTGDRKIESLDSVLAFLKEQIVDSTMVPPISKQYNATEASAKEMMPFFHANIIEPIQEIITEKLADDVYAPYLEDAGYSVRLVPEILWEPPDADREETAEYYKGLVEAQIMPPEYAADALGFGDEYRAWRKEEDRRELERMTAQRAFQQQQEQPTKKRWQVTELG